MNKPPFNFSLPKKQYIRLLNADQYNKVFTDTHIKQGNKHALLLAHNTTLPYPRLGLVVAKKKIPLAVNRNRFKRLARECFNKNIDKLPSIDLIILARQDINKLSKQQQNEVFSKIFSKLYIANQ